MRRIAAAVVAGVLAAVPAAVVSSGDPARGDGRGGCPGRVISMAPHATAVLFAIGAGPVVVAADTFSLEPAGAAELPKLGSYLDPDIEGIVAMRPDLVVLAPGAARLAEDLGRFGVRTVTAPDTRMDDVYATIEVLGRATCRRDEATRLAGALRAELASVSGRGAAGRPPRVVLVVDRTPDDLRGLFVAGRDNFLSDLVAASGGRNVFADARAGFPQVSLEPILAADPDLIVELMPGASASEAARRVETWRQLVPGLRAVRGGFVRVLTGRSVPVPGPGAAGTVRELAALVDAARAAGETPP